MTLKLRDWKTVTAVAAKALAAKKGKLTVEAPSVAKAFDEYNKMSAVFLKARDQFSQILEKYDQSLEGFRLASTTYRKKLENDAYQLDEDDPEEKKLMQSTDAVLYRTLDDYIALAKERQASLEKAVDALNHLNKMR